jgi:hypothetical protein
MKRKSLDKTEQKLVTSIEREMNLPRLTESVREAKEEATLAAKKRT